MVLGRALIDRGQTSYPMAGLLPASIRASPSPGCIWATGQIELLSPYQLGRLGANYRGHEFHYAREVERSGSPLFRARCARGQDLGDQGCRSGQVVELVPAPDRPCRRPAAGAAVSVSAILGDA